MERVTRAQANAGRTACTVCHRRKVKCDAHDVGFPCSNCRTASRTDECHLHEKRRRVSRLKAASMGAVSPTTITMASPPSSTQVVVDSRNSEPRDMHTGQQQQQQQQQQQEQQPPQEPSPRSTTSLAGLPLDSADFERYLVEFIDQPRITQRPIDRDARIAYIGTDLSNINFLLRQQLQQQQQQQQQQQHSSSGNLSDDASMMISHYPTNRIARHHTCHEPDRLPVEAFQLPPKSEVDQLLSAYFSHVNPGFPVVDEDIFMTQYRVRDARNPPSLLLLHAILVSGAHVLYRDDPETRESQKRTFFRRAKMLFDARFERNRDSVVQASLLLTWHTDGAEDVLANAWFWVGVAVRTAVGLGMHRDAEGSTLVGHNKRTWRRLWWILVQCDVVLAMQYGRPLMIDLAESDVKPLRREDFAGCGEGARYEYCMQATELCLILAEGIKGISRLSATAETKAGILRNVDEALASWMLRLPGTLNSSTGQWTASASSSVGIDPWAAMLQIQYNAALILLHRRQPGREDSEICTTAAITIQQTFQLLCERDQDRFLWISSVNCLFAALIQLSVDVRISNPVLAISAFRRYESALYCLERLAQHWPNALSILHFFQRSVQAGKSYSEAIGATRRVGEEEARGSLTDEESRAYHGTRVDRIRQHHPEMAAHHHGSQDPASNIHQQDTPQNSSGSEQCGVKEGSTAETRMRSSSDDRCSSEHNNSLESTDNVIDSWQAWQRAGGQLQDLTEEWLFTY